VLDLNLPGTNGTEAFEEVVEAAPEEQADGYRLRRTVRAMIDRRAAESLALDNEIATATLDSIGAGLLRTDLCGNVAYMNPWAEKLTGWQREEALGHPVSDILRLVDSASGATVDNAVETVLQPNGSALGAVCNQACKLVRRDGVELGIENRVTRVHDQSGNIIGAVMAFRDVTVSRAALIEFSRLAEHDPLTGLPNRALFNDRLMQAISLAKRQGKQLAVLFVDVDQFKRINDSLGHAMGDKLLCSVARRITACVRRSDTVCRLGGDEFLVLLSEVAHGVDAAFSAGKILRAVAAPHVIDDKSIDVSVSIGGSTYPANSHDAESLLNQADAAMYEVKQQGRNGYQFFRSDMQIRLALDAPGAGNAASAAIPGHCGRVRFNCSHRTVGVIGSMQAIAGVERSGTRNCPGCGKRLRNRIPRQGFSVRGASGADCYRSGACQSGTGTDRDCVDAGCGVGRSYPPCAEGHGRTAHHRRLLARAIPALLICGAFRWTQSNSINRSCRTSPPTLKTQPL
jgi:diguanylate cyclase (GGDEF)-like protein/PAS domain S-box-containing protein